MSHVTNMNESCHTNEWVMSHQWMSNVTHINEPCYKYEWAISNKRMSLSHITPLLYVSYQQVTTSRQYDVHSKCDAHSMWCVFSVTHMNESFISLRCYMCPINKSLRHVMTLHVVWTTHRYHFVAMCNVVWYALCCSEGRFIWGLNNP